MADYEYTVQVRRFDSDKWLPIACNTYADATATVEHVLRDGGEYDVARVAQRRGTSNVFAVVETVRRAILPDPV